MKPISTGIRFNIIAVEMKVFENGKKMKIGHKTLHTDVSHSFMKDFVHAAECTYGKGNVLVEPARLYLLSDFGII